MQPDIKSLSNDKSERNFLYSVPRVPAFQNKLYATQTEAQSCQIARVDLVCDPETGLVYNASFDNSLMDYDDGYQNSQDHSPIFRDYLDQIADLILRDIDKETEYCIEIGCGKGYFLQLLHDRGVSIKGYDPTFEGENPLIEKTYFHQGLVLERDANHIIMRHTLEHIENPYQFLKDLKGFLPQHTRIHIEVPRFEWIEEKKSFWDIFHEHANYFTEEFFQRIFGLKATVHRVFGDQYMVVSASLHDLQDNLAQLPPVPSKEPLDFDVESYQKKLKMYQTNYIWGAGAKGIAFSNTLDPYQDSIQAIIDIHPRKQNCFTPLSGHPCVAPEAISWQDLNEEACLWIMNPNYQAEIISSLPKNRKFHIEVLNETKKPCA
jgi:hypothetical protein